MSTIVTRAGKGSALTHNEVDANFTNLNTDKVEKNGTDPVVITANSSSDALRVTQTGAGNALVVEDSANPDSTPFVIDSTGRAIIGDVTSQNSAYRLQSVGTNGGDLLTQRWANASGGSVIRMSKSRGTSVGTNSAVISGDTLSTLWFEGDDGSSFIQAAGITAQVDGTPGTNDMPGRLVFSTTADGDSTPTERLRISSSGAIDMASTSSLQKNSTNAYTLKNITYLTSGTAATYTTPAGVRALKVTVIGGGGGGGGVDGQATASTNAYSYCGGGAGYATAFIATAESSYTYTVGAGGTGGAAGNNAGTAGGTTEFKNSGSTVVISATGGGAGDGSIGATSVSAIAGTPGVGSITGLGSPGGIIGSGTGVLSTGYGRIINGTVYCQNSSGYCPIIGGGVFSPASTTGTNATNYGEGGSGVRTATASSSNYAGGNGYQGLIIIEEYY